jgi:hypothetical protein
LSNKWVRFLIAVVAIAAAGGAAYRAIDNERRLSSELTAAHTADLAGEVALTSLAELKAALHAYVVPGQGQPFWTQRAAMLLDKLRRAVLDMDSVAAANDASLTEALDTTDRLGAAEQRAREHLRNGQALLAADVIFTEVRDLLDALRIQLAQTRDQISARTRARESTARLEQLWLIGGAAAVLILGMLLLVPVGREPSFPGPPPDGERATSARGTIDESFAAANPPVTRTARGGPETRPAPSAAAPVLAAPVMTVDLPAAAAVCTDLARVADSNEIGGLLSRASSVLDAKGIILWISSNDRSELFPVASAGYDQRVISRIGSLAREATNLTADAFRQGNTRASAASIGMPCAVAIALAGPEGPVGVLSAELDGAEVGKTRIALAEIFAAQLATLIGSLPAAPSSVESGLSRTQSS